MSKVVLVTGSSNGIGRGTIIRFAREGYNVIINYNKDEKNAYALKEETEKKYGVSASVLRCDISNEEDVKNMVSKIIEQYGHIDVLVNNAAIEICSDFNEKDRESFIKVLNTNVVGTFLVSKYVGNEMKKVGKGRIINISSNNGIDKYDPSTLEYDASKSAVINMTYNLAKEFAPYIKVNCVAPGWVKTEKIEQLDKSLDNKFIASESEKILLGRFANVEEIANVIYFLSSEEASYINGAVIRVDGGY
ncbi:MAG: SDR family NAD(P)-dependent oxidoreductase [Bacilli bacterium]